MRALAKHFVQLISYEDSRSSHYRSSFKELSSSKYTFTNQLVLSRNARKLCWVVIGTTRWAHGLCHVVSNQDLSTNMSFKPCQPVRRATFKAHSKTS